MARLMESIERYGIMNPLLVMPTTEGFYWIISGHRRKYCAEKHGYTQVPANIRYMKEDDSIISMVNSNLHKEKIRSRFGYSLIDNTNQILFCIPAVTENNDMFPALKFRYDFTEHSGNKFQFGFFFCHIQYPGGTER